MLSFGWDKTGNNMFTSCLVSESTCMFSQLLQPWWPTSPSRQPTNRPCWTTRKWRHTSMSLVTLCIRYVPMPKLVVLGNKKIASSAYYIFRAQNKYLKLVRCLNIEIATLLQSVYDSPISKFVLPNCNLFGHIHQKNSMTDHLFWALIQLIWIDCLFCIRNCVNFLVNSFTCRSPVVHM